MARPQADRHFEGVWRGVSSFPVMPGRTRTLLRSLPGLTRQSMRRHRTKSISGSTDLSFIMDARVKPGHDEVRGGHRRDGRVASQIYFPAALRSAALIRS